MVKIIRIREERCTGCRVCEMICSLDKDGVFNPRKSRIKILRNRAKGLDIPAVCQVCDSAPCANICPTGSLQKYANNGTISIEMETCLGEKCLKCTIACEYGAITWDVLNESLICCDFCDGDPECVKFCDHRAIIFEKCDQPEIRQQRKHLQKILKPFFRDTSSDKKGGH